MEDLSKIAIESKVISQIDKYLFKNADKYMEANKTS